MDVNVEGRQEPANSAEAGFYPLHEEDDDDVSMQSPLSGMDDQDMHDDDDDDHSDDDRSDNSSVSDHSTDEGEGEEDDEDDDDEDDDEDEDEDDDDEEDDDEFEEHQHLHMSRRPGGHGSSRRASSSRLWGSLDSELSILDALDEVDEEEFSYVNMLDDEAFFAEEQRRRSRLAATRNVRSGTSDSDGGAAARRSEDRLVESMRDALGLYNGGGSATGTSSAAQTLVLTFGDVESEEEADNETRSDSAATSGRLGNGNGLGSSLGTRNPTGSSAGNMFSTSLLQYIEELPDMLDDDFLFDSFDAVGRGDRSRRERQLGRTDGNGVDQLNASATTHPLLRTSGRGDAILLDANARGLGSRGGDVIGGAASNPVIWGPSGVGRDVDVRSVASRLEQQITRICADDDEPPTTSGTDGRDEEASRQQQQRDDDDAMDAGSSTGTPRSGEHTASETRTVDDATESTVVPTAPTNSDRTESHETVSEAASVLALASTFGESSIRFRAASSQSAAASDANTRVRTTEEESKAEDPPTETQSTVEAVTHELSTALLNQQEEEQVYQCPEGMDAEVFASLPPDMQAEIVAQNAPAVAESTSARSDTATAGGGGGSESMSQMDLDMANSSFDRETLEALPPDIRAEVLENERREREAAARAETADTSRAQEMDNASFVASLAPELREEILITCDDAFLQTLSSQVRAEAMVLRERAAFRSTYRERDRGTEERGGGGDGEMDELFNRPTLRRMLTSHSSERGSNRRRSRIYYEEFGGGRRSSRREYRQGTGGSTAHKGMLRVEKDEEEDASERIFDDRCVRGLLRLLFMTQSVIQNRVFQRLLANICLYPLTRCSVRRNLLRVISLPLAEPLVPGDEKDDDDDGSGKIQFPPSSLYGCGIDGNRAIGKSTVPAEVVNRMLHVLVSLAKYNPRFTVEMLQPHGMRHQARGEGGLVKKEQCQSGECGVAVLIDLLALPVVYCNGTNLDALLELLELVLSPLERLHKPRSEDEEKKEGDEDDASTAELGDEWVAVPAVELDEAHMGKVVAVLGMDLCTVQMQERTLAVLKLLNHVHGNRLDPLWDALSASLTEARAKGGLDDQDGSAVAASSTTLSPGTSATASESQAAAPGDDAEGTVIEGKSAGASCAMAALLARFLPMVEAFFVVTARDAASMSLRVPDSSEREEAFVAALR
uniref:HECT domain-containing protein n=1 Tax=Phytophthora ramorum TaxID=164328 RepID=H3GVG0_PHYRM